ncbi:hypothetical protein E2986_10733 [Frieseomelitta varia]|uniref:Cytochrome oxidase subunit II copper A binding domain-containing protein n=1 Tax=Frieseomelitta varia TaxID=561572 RepID=A0A833VWW6_9HYME|nr:hypothetical protein E2986_10733 [Frieseomelitta varia]
MYISHVFSLWALQYLDKAALRTVLFTPEQFNHFDIKIDAIPGRINQLNLFSFRPGLFLARCSEICGINLYTN